MKLDNCFAVSKYNTENTVIKHKEKRNFNRIYFKELFDLKITSLKTLNKLNNETVNKVVERFQFYILFINHFLTINVKFNNFIFFRLYKKQLFSWKVKLNSKVNLMFYYYTYVLLPCTHNINTSQRNNLDSILFVLKINFCTVIIKQKTFILIL